MTKFYGFAQTNSGGRFRHDEQNGVGYFVSIEAQSANHANEIAERIGIYFNGCANGIDCNCCGDRWHEASEYDATDTPQRYGEPVTGGWGYPAYIHYLDGRVERIEDSA